MTRLSAVSHSELIKRLRNLGFTGPFGGGKHLFMVRGNLRLTIPNPHRREIGTELLSRILKQAGVDRDDWDSQK
jgi:predicted RNA binding protein YcfA (HicA-like mRNA interferase family)